LQQLVSDAVVGLSRELTVPYVLFGHSLGALVAYELAHELPRAGANAPVHLIVAGRVAPSVTLPDASIHTLADAELIHALRTKYNAIPAEILEERDLLQLLLPGIRADFRLHETYVYRGRPPLSCGLSAYGGLRDESVTESDLLAWRSETKERFSKTMIDGDHFFVHTRSDFTRALSVDLETIISRI